MALGARQILPLMAVLALLTGVVAGRPVVAQSQQGLPVVVELDLPPLGQVDGAMTAAERRAYAARVASVQDGVAREIIAQGGTVLGRFTVASSGLAALLPQGGARPLAALSSVRALRQVASYTLDGASPGLRAAAAAALPQAPGNGGGTSIAVVDSGIDYTHLALGGPGTVAAYNAAAANNTTIDDNPFFPNARVKGGYDYVGEQWPEGAIAPDPDPLDAAPTIAFPEAGHGTAVADIAAGSTPGRLGVAPAADLYAFKACSARARLCNGLSLLLAVDDALDLDNNLATRDPATVIVLALSAAYGQPEDDLSAYVDIAAAAGSIVVASAGNYGDRPYIIGAPGTAAGAISVGATTPSVGAAQLPTLAEESARGPRLADGRIKPDLVAPSGSTAARVGTGSAAAALGGTSSAVPVVAGAAALLAAQYGTRLTPAAYRALLTNTATSAAVASSEALQPEPVAIGLRSPDTLNVALRSTLFGRAPRLLVGCTDGRSQLLDPTADTSVRSDAPSRAFGTSRVLRVRDEAKAPGESFALLRFPAPTCTASSGELQIEASKIISPTSGTLLAYTVRGSWNEATTWNSRPAVGTVAAQTPVTATGLLRLDVTSLIGTAPVEIALRGGSLLSAELVSSQLGGTPRVLLDCVAGGPRVLDAEADTYVREDVPTTAFGGLGRLRVGADASFRRFTLLRFPQPTCVPTQAALQLDAVEVYNSRTGRRGGTLEATTVGGAWDEGATWNTRPPLGTTLAQRSIRVPGVVSLDVTAAFSGQQQLVAPITLQGAGALNLRQALATSTLAWVDGGSATPTYSQTASLSFGYQAVTSTLSMSQVVRVRNLDSATHTYTASIAFRDDDDRARGVQVSVTPSRLTVPAGEDALLQVTLAVDAAELRPWSLNAGSLGNLGSSVTNPLSPSFTLFEYDGLLTINGGANNTVRLPWQVLPKRAAAVQATTSPLTLAPGAVGSIALSNQAASQAGTAEVFALMEQSPNIYSYTVGTATGENQSPIDLKEIGVRDRTDAAGDSLLEFAATIHDKPFRTAQYPVQIAILVDTDRDGSDDYSVFTDDRSRNGRDGRNAVFVQPTSPVDAPATFVGFVDRDFNTQNWIVPVPTAALGLAAGSAFEFEVRAIDNIFPPSPGTVVYDRSARLFYQLGVLAVRPAAFTITVPPAATLPLGVSASTLGSTALPTQQGLLLLYRQAPVGRESEAIPITIVTSYP